MIHRCEYSQEALSFIDTCVESDSRYLDVVRDFERIVGKHPKIGVPFSPPLTVRRFDARADLGLRTLAFHYMIKGRRSGDEVDLTVHVMFVEFSDASLEFPYYCGPNEY